MTRALIDSIDRRWKFTSGALSWHPDDKVSPEKEEEVMNVFERVAFAGLEPDQRNILWVRHLHAGHHELHFVIPRLELSSGKDFNACPPGWHKDFDVFRDLFNWREGWARPDDPARAREDLPKNADLFKARMARWGKEIMESDRDRIKEAIHAHLKAKIAQGLIRNQADILTAMTDAGYTVNRAGKGYISVKSASGDRLRFKGGIYAETWMPKKETDEGKTDEERREKTQRNVARLEGELERVITKRETCNHKRYPVKWAAAETALTLPQPKRGTNHDGNGTHAEPDLETHGRELRSQTDSLQPEAGDSGGKPDAPAHGIARFKEIIQRCQRSVQQLADLVGEIEKRRVEREAEQSPRIRMR